MSKFPLCCILVFFSFQVRCQPSIQSYLMEAENDANLSLFESQSKLLSTTSYRLSVLDEIQLRTENDEFMLDQQEYGVRIKPNSPWEIKANNAVYDAQKKILRLKQELHYKKLLYERYQHILDYIYFDQLTQVYSNQIKLISKGMAVLSDMSNLKEINTDYIIKLKLEYLELNDQLLESRNNKERIQGIILSTQTSSITPEWSYDQIVGAPDILNMIDQDTSSTPAILMLQQEEINKSTKEYEYEKSKRDVGFVQTNYRPARKRENQIEVSLGLSIPLGNNKPKLMEKKLDIMEEQFQYETVKERLEEDQSKKYTELLRTIEKHSVLDSLYDNWYKSGFAEAAQLRDSNDPENYLKLELSMLKLSAKVIDTRHNMLTDYIDWLFVNDRLQKSPFVDFLSKK